MGKWSHGCGVQNTGSCSTKELHGLFLRLSLVVLLALYWLFYGVMNVCYASQVVPVPAGVLSRVSPSFLRFGSVQLAARRQVPHDAVVAFEVRCCPL